MTFIGVCFNLRNTHKIVCEFIQDYYKGLNLTLKIRRFCEKIYKFQRRLRMVCKNKRDRQEIISQKFANAQRKIQMELFKKNNKKLEERLRKIPLEIY